MTNETNKRIVSDFWTAFEANDRGTLEAVLAPDLRAHSPFAPEPIERDAHLQGVAMFNEAFSDRDFAVEVMIAEGNTVATRTTMRGTHTGVFQGHPPTGTRIETTGLTMERIEDGRIVERWFNFDIAGVLQELGISMDPERG